MNEKEKPGDTDDEEEEEEDDDDDDDDDDDEVACLLAVWIDAADVDNELKVTTTRIMMVDMYIWACYQMCNWNGRWTMGIEQQEGWGGGEWMTWSDDIPGGEVLSSTAQRALDPAVVIWLDTKR